MSDDVATVEALFRQFAREPGRAFEVYDEHVVWDSRALAAGADLQGVFHGHDGVRAWWRAWLEAWESIDVVDGPHHRANAGRVVSWWRQRVRGKRSGATVEMEVGIVWTFEGGRIVRVALFPLAAEARRAAGLLA